MRRFYFLKASSSHLVIVHYSGAQHYPFSNHLQHRGTRRKQTECPSDSVMHSALRNNTMIQHQPNETACVTTECNNEEFLHFWKASPGLVWMPRQLTSQLVCERKLKQLPSGHMRKITPNRRCPVIFTSQQAHIALMLQCPQPTVAFSLKNTKTRHHKCQRVTECTLTFIQLCLQTLTLFPLALILTCSSRKSHVDLVLEETPNESRTLTGTRSFHLVWASKFADAFCCSVKTLSKLNSL